MATNLASASVKSTIGGTTRTFGARFSDVKNVRDFGAVGDGSTDDTAAIQAAVNYTTAPYSSANRGTIYFPQGTYKTTAAVTYETASLNIAFVGEPGAKVIGNFADALFKRSVNSPISGVHSFENLILENSHASGKCIMFHSCVTGKVVNCQLSASGAQASSIGIETYNSQCITVDACLIIGFGVGIMAGNATMVLDCDITGCVHGVRHQNVGLTVHGGRFEVNTVGIMLGMDESGSNFTSSGFDIAGLSMEANQTGIYCNTGAAGKISACSIQGGVAMAHGLRITTAQDVVVEGVVAGGSASPTSYSGAAITISGATRLTLISVSTLVAGGTDWAISTGLDSLQMINCNKELTVSQLPTSATVNTSLAVSDATGTTAGATVSGGGSSHVAVVRSAGVWRII